MQPLEVSGFAALRRHVLSGIHGDVLEVGAGSGLNSSHYPASGVSRLTVTDRDLDRPALLRAFARGPVSPDRVCVREADLMALPFDERLFDSIACTLVLCSVPNVTTAAREMMRVLRPGGVIHFMEHIQSPRRRLKPLFDKVTPAWRRLADGCHLNRDTPSLLEAAGLRVVLERVAFDGILVTGYATAE